MINKLIKEALLEILNGESREPETATNHPMLGQKVLVRCRNAGVHYGTLSYYGEYIILSDSNRIWKWEGAFTLSEVSTRGIEKGRVACTVQSLSIPILDLAEIIPLTDQANELLNANIES